ncbi:unnamed protein product [Rotaria magnacalcarata]|uniref:NAD(P)(+)--arginine ADP-ribosyltransferase n=1 Tax=Rotaria magnacalcarata TaxID=392030 RepID=A0A820M465_9BILA|nr:unnamed protein product [Rotaria magnacalcarata]CAF4368043.1 unnamed protein product [Rotaria magnacalcarata]
MSLSTHYLACRKGDLSTVEQILPSLSLDEINQLEPNGSTSLHAACFFNHPQIVKLLLEHGASRTVLNKYGYTPLQEAITDEIKELFYRKAADAQGRFTTDLTTSDAMEWVSVKNGIYGWRNKRKISDMNVVKAADCITHDKRFCNAADMNKIKYFLDKTRQTQDPYWLLKAYTAGADLCRSINKSLASGPSDIYDLFMEDDFHSFVGCFFHHEALKKYRYSGKCYRGLKLAREDFESNYEPDEQLLIKPFMSTSKLRSVAENFALSPSDDPNTLSVLCIYTIPERTLSFRDNVALDISSISEYPHEQEVLILPYTSLTILNVSHMSSGLTEIEFEWFSFRQYLLGPD